MGKIIFIFLFLIMSLFSGCKTLNPPENETSQPWAQPESWETTKGIPGFSGRDVDDFS